MKPCEFESRVISAAKGGKPNDLILEHLTTCRACQEAYSVASALGQLAETTQAEVPPMVSANLLWLKAELNAKPPSRTNLHVISVSVIVLALLVGHMLYRLFWSGPSHSASFSLPIAGSPFPLDAGFVVVVVALVLVLMLPASGSGKSPQRNQTKLFSI